MWRVEDHTADVCLRVEAQGWSALLREATLAFASWISADGWPEPAAQDARTVEVRGADPTDAWVRWWRALHRLWAVEGLLPVRAEVADEARPEETRAVLSCVAESALDASACSDVKAVTWHGAEAAASEDGTWRGRIVLDV